MSHLGERITDYVFKELSPNDAREVERHLAGCAECRSEVEVFRRTHSMLQATPFVEPPRRIVFEVEKPRSLAWRWLAPLSAAAALLLVAFIAAPIQVRWSDSQLTVAFGNAPQTPRVAPIVASSPAPSVQVSAQPIDYERIVREVQNRQDARLASELGKRDAAHERDMQRVQGELVYIDSVQRSMLKDTIENASSIQLLAQRNE